MNFRHTAIVLSFTVAAFVAVVLVHPVHAAATSSVATSTNQVATSTNATSTPAAPVDACVPSAADIGKIVKIENDPALSYAEEIRQELLLRRQLLSQTIMCAENDTLALQASLNAVSVSGDVANLQSQLGSKLHDAINFYNIELNKVGTAGISGTEAIAKEVLTYRASSYEPLEGEVSDFVIWSGNQNLFDVAQTRMDQTSRAVSFLESATPSSDLENAFVAAKASFTDAINQNQAAKNALLQSFPADQSLALIQQSLTSLSDTYKQFFTVSTIIQSLLPH